MNGFIEKKNEHIIHMVFFLAHLLIFYSANMVYNEEPTKDWRTFILYIASISIVYGKQMNYI